MNQPLSPFDADPPDPSAGQGHQGLPKTTMMVAVVAILTAGVATFLAMQWTGSRAVSSEISQQVEEVTLQENELSQQLGEIRGQLTDLEQKTSVLGTGKFVICNNDQMNLTIKHLSSTFLNPTGEFETFSTESYGEDLWVIPPGAKVNLDFGGGRIWDGSVTYYSVVLEVEEAQYPFSGYWKPEQTDCVLKWPSV